MGPTPCQSPTLRACPPAMTSLLKVGSRPQKKRTFYYPTVGTIIELQQQKSEGVIQGIKVIIKKGKEALNNVVPPQWAQFCFRKLLDDLAMLSHCDANCCPAVIFPPFH